MLVLSTDMIHNYYTSDALTVCTACMIRIELTDINDVRMYHVREHEIGSFGRLDGKSYTNYKEPLYSIFSCRAMGNVPTLHTLKKNYCEQYWKIEVRRL